MSRSCDGCTKCCEGFLSGEAEGKTFYPGKPCHFVALGTGCAIYAKRPKDPCVSYVCAWRSGDELPVWMKPSEVDAIVDRRATNDGSAYLYVHEAGRRLDSRVLSWMIEYALATGQNLTWELDGGKHWVGTPAFVAEMAAL